MRHPSSAVPIGLLLLVGLGGCDDGSEAVPAATESAPPSMVTVIADEYSYRPSTLVTTGAATIRLNNVGALAHTWTVVAEPIEDELELRPELVLAEARAEAGQSATVDLRALGAGRYQIVCAIPGHVSAGMLGELVIEG